MSGTDRPGATLFADRAPPLAVDAFIFNDGSRNAAARAAAGTPGNDTLTGDNLANTLEGFAGNDSLIGLDGNDLLLGGNGDDTMEGGNHDDTLDGGSGSDLGTGGDGNDSAVGGTGNDTLFGNNGNDHLAGDAGNDSLDGGPGIDLIDGGDGEDTLRGEGDGDTILGGSDADLIFGGDGRDSLRGGDGNDIVRGDNDSDTLIGDGGDDVLEGGPGIDLLEGGTGNDTMEGGEEGDSLSGGEGDDSLSGNNGRDTILGDAGNDTLFGDNDSDSMIGGDGHDSLHGGRGTDVLDGGPGNDTLRGGEEADTMSGGEGKDYYVGTPEDFNGDVILDFSFGDNLSMDTVFRPTDMVQTATLAQVRLDRDSDGTDEIIFELRGDFTRGFFDFDIDSGGIFGGGSTVLTYLARLPDLAERTALPGPFVNGMFIDTPQIRPGKGEIQLQLDADRSGASYRNTLGVYEVDKDGNIVNVQVLVNDTTANPGAQPSFLSPKTLDGTNKLGWFLVQGAANWAESLSSTDTLSFVDRRDSTTANVADGANVTLAVNGVAVPSVVFHSWDKSLNPDGLEHVVSGVIEGGNTRNYFVGFEDEIGGGDMDYQDVLFSSDDWF